MASRSAGQYDSSFTLSSAGSCGRSRSSLTLNSKVDCSRPSFSLLTRYRVFPMGIMSFWQSVSDPQSRGEPAFSHSALSAAVKGRVSSPLTTVTLFRSIPFHRTSLTRSSATNSRPPTLIRCR